MSSSLKRTSVWIVAAILLSQVLFCVPSKAQNTLEEVFRPNGHWQWSPRRQGGLVLKDPNCKCPKKRPLWNEDESKAWPTRCLKGNRDAGGEYRPVDDYQNPYPDNEYPKGFPVAMRSSVKGRRNEIPFPGWPAAKPPSGKRVSAWDYSLRKSYKTRYVKEGGIRPGYADQDYQERSKKLRKKGTGWEYWQIHHILERKYNGTDDDGNFVPVYSYPNSKGKDHNSNRHNAYTRWWQRIRVDSEFGPGREYQEYHDTWEVIKDCKVVNWPSAK